MGGIEKINGGTVSGLFFRTLVGEERATHHFLRAQNRPHDTGPVIANRTTAGGRTDSRARTQQHADHGHDLRIL